MIFGPRKISLLSIESAGDGKPWLDASENLITPADLLSAIETWSAAKKYVAQNSGLPTH